MTTVVKVNAIDAESESKLSNPSAFTNDESKGLFAVETGAWS